jgi:predicted lipoprotein with Yx(FWY)xxD motif
MNTNSKRIGLLLVFVLVLAACAPAPTEVPATLEPTEPAATETQTTEPVATETPVVAETATAEETLAAGTPTTGVPVTGSATLNVNQTAGYGPVLVDNQGRSLYVFMGDTQNSGASTCTDACATAWPPLTSTGELTADEGLDPSLLGTITRPDGSTQVTYNGWPLYAYQGDAVPGDTAGQGMNNQWYLVSPAGTAVQQ